MVATYTAPGPLRIGNPKGVRALRRGSLLTVSWSRVPGAAGYATTISLSNGHRSMLFSRHASVTFTGIDPGLGARIAVLALGANTTRGTPGTAFSPRRRAARRRR